MLTHFGNHKMQNKIRKTVDRRKLRILIWATILIFSVGALVTYLSHGTQSSTVLPIKHRSRPNLRLSSAMSVEQWKKNAMDSGAPSMVCFDGVCTARNLCYKEDQYQQLYTIDKTLYTSQIKMEGEFIRDIYRWSAKYKSEEIVDVPILYLRGNTFLFGWRYGENIYHFCQKLMQLFHLVRKEHTIHNVLHFPVMETGPFSTGTLSVIRQMADWNDVLPRKVLEDLPKEQRSKALICMESVVFLDLSKQQRPFYTTAEEIRDYRELLYNKYNLGPVTNAPRTITIVNRVNNRRIHNISEFVSSVTSIAEKLGFKVQLVFLEKLTFLEQIQLIKNTGVLISMHGAALTNALFLQDGAAVIEIFPLSTYSFRRRDYGQFITRQLQVSYFDHQIHDTEQIVRQGTWTEDEIYRCCKLKEQSVNCGLKFQTHADTIVQPEKFASLLIQAIIQVRKYPEEKPVSTFY